MKKTMHRNWLAWLFLVVSGTAWCQMSGPDGSDRLEHARALVQASQVAILRAELGLTSEESAAFWPVYEAYVEETTIVRDRYVALIVEYLGHMNNGTLTDDVAGRMLADYFGIRKELLDTRSAWVDRFAEVLPMVRVARFTQLENQLQANIDIELALVIPLAEGN